MKDVNSSSARTLAGWLPAILLLSSFGAVFAQDGRLHGTFEEFLEQMSSDASGNVIYGMDDFIPNPWQVGGPPISRLDVLASGLTQANGLTRNYRHLGFDWHPSSLAGNRLFDGTIFFDIGGLDPSFSGYSVTDFELRVLTGDMWPLVRDRFRLTIDGRLLSPNEVLDFIAAYQKVPTVRRLVNCNPPEIIRLEKLAGSRPNPPGPAVASPCNIECSPVNLALQRSRSAGRPRIIQPSIPLAVELPAALAAALANSGGNRAFLREEIDRLLDLVRTGQMQGLMDDVEVAEINRKLAEIEMMEMPSGLYWTSMLLGGKDSNESWQGTFVQEIRTDLETELRNSLPGLSYGTQTWADWFYGGDPAYSF